MSLVIVAQPSTSGTTGSHATLLAPAVLGEDLVLGFGIPCSGHFLLAGPVYRCRRRVLFTTGDCRTHTPLHAIIASISPLLTLPPAVASSDFTLPLMAEAMVFSIFMASTTATGEPASTSCPT